MKSIFRNINVPDFKDVLILPKRSSVSSRNHVSLHKKIIFQTSKPVQWNGIPIISSNMDTVTDLNTFKVFNRYDYLTCFPKHFNYLFNQKYLTKNDFPQEFRHTDRYMLSCGINRDDYSEMIKTINNFLANDIKIKFICIDVANGYLTQMHDICNLFRELYPEIVIIAGNVVTPECIYDLIKLHGVNIVKIGIGSGSVCETRLKTGVGFPQFAAVVDCSEAAHQAGGYIISDGGVRDPGDIAKAFAGGADFVMGGGIFAGHIESPGTITVDRYGNKFKELYGMSSKEANEKYNGGLKEYRTSEGKKILVPLKGSLEETIKDIGGGLRSACTYVNARNLDELRENAEFIKLN